MIHIIEQDLFNNEAQAYWQCCNCFNRMYSGVAAGFRKFYPEAVEADNKTIEGDKSKFGKYSVAHAKNGKYIYNLYGQYNYGTDTRKLNYEALYTAMESALTDCISKKIRSIAIPFQLGCGLAGGNWNIVYIMIQEVFKNFDGDVYICKLKS
jgi:hypothetical protein